MSEKFPQVCYIRPCKGYVILCLFVISSFTFLDVHTYKRSPCTQHDHLESMWCGPNDGRFSELGVYKQINGSGDGVVCLFYSRQELNWSSSQAKCERDFGNLVWIENATDYSSIIGSRDGNEAYWTGLNDQIDEGQLLFHLTSDPINVSSSFQWPFDRLSQSADRDCGVITADGRTVQMSNCSETHRFVCKLDTDIFTGGDEKVDLSTKDFIIGEEVTINCSAVSLAPGEPIHVLVENTLGQHRFFADQNKDNLQSSWSSLQSRTEDTYYEVLDARCVRMTRVSLEFTVDKAFSEARISCCSTPARCELSAPITVKDPIYKPKVYVMGENVTDAGNVTRHWPETSVALLLCEAYTGTEVHLGLALLDWTYGREGDTRWAHNFHVDRPHYYLPREAKEVTLTRLNFQKNTRHGNHLSVQFTVRFDASYRQTRFLCSSGGDILTRLGGFEVLWPVFDVYFFPGPPTMSSQYGTDTPTIYGGDTVTATCEADVGTLNNDSSYSAAAGIVWTLATRGRSYTWSGRYSLSPPGHPDWVNIKSTPASLICPPGDKITTAALACFTHESSNVTWHEARGLCQQNEKDLAVIYDKATNDQLNANSKPYWIGINDVLKEGEYVWLDEDELPYHAVTQFGPREQDRAQWEREGEDCAFLLTDWHMTQCNRTMPFICMSPHDTVARPFRPDAIDRQDWRPPRQVSRIEMVASTALQDARLTCLSFDGDMTRFIPDPLAFTQFAYWPNIAARVTLRFKFYFETKKPRLSHRYLDAAKTLVHINCSAYVGEGAVLRWLLAARGYPIYYYEVRGNNSAKKPPFLFNVTNTESFSNVTGPHVSSTFVLKLKGLERPPSLQCYPHSPTGQAFKSRLHQSELVAFLDLWTPVEMEAPDTRLIKLVLGTVLLLILLTSLLILCRMRSRSQEGENDDNFLFEMASKLTLGSQRRHTSTVVTDDVTRSSKLTVRSSTRTGAMSLRDSNILSEAGTMARSSKGSSGKTVRSL